MNKQHNVISQVNIQRKDRLHRFVYRATLIFFIILFISTCALLPVDTLIQSTKNSQSSANLAVNTIIVITFYVIFILVSLLFAAYRFLNFYQSLSEIPKRYVPVHMNDFTNKAYHQYVTDNIKQCQLIYHESMTPKEPVEHDGLSSPIKDESVIPSSLIYEDVVRSIGDKIKLTSDERFHHLSFREIFSTHGENKALVQLYEKLRFSNKAISQDEFLQFLVEFVKLSR